MGKLNTIEEALVALRNGQFALVVDDFDRENEGDFIGIASHATKESVRVMLKYTTGIICTTMNAKRAKELELPLMIQNNEDPYRTAFTVTIDYKHGTSTGVSPSDRAATIVACARHDTKPSDFSRPGHVFPLISREGGVMVRGGHTEASVDLARLAGVEEVAYLCEVYNHETGEMCRVPELEVLSEQLQLPFISIADLQRFRFRTERIVSFDSPGTSLKFFLNTPLNEIVNERKIHELSFSSIYNDQKYNVIALATGPFSGSDAKLTLSNVSVVFTDINGNLDDISASISKTISTINIPNSYALIVSVSVAPWQNVKGKESSNMSASEPLVGPSSSPQPSAYSNLFTSPEGLEIAVKGSGFAVHSVCDRVTAEVAQVILASMTKISSNIEVVLPASDFPELDLIRLSVFSNHPVVRVWEYGLSRVDLVF